jgi:hypothetical protein
MKSCDKCATPNPDDALFCHQCGTPLTQPGSAPLDEVQLWRAFIGPNSDRYLEQFRKFTVGPTPRFALTWHWPAFLVDPFLWFLYRKMYLYALVYAVGPVISAYVTGDFTVGIVWRIMAGASANYIYFWHIKEHLKTMREQGTIDRTRQEHLLRDLGGVQPYVIWLGVALHALLLVILAILIMGGPPGNRQPTKTTPASPEKAKVQVDARQRRDISH